MLYLVTIAGLIIAVVLFLNLLSAKDGAAKRPSKGKGEKAGPPPALNPAKVYGKNSPYEGGPRPRICPVCGTLLGPEDFLYAAIDNETKGGAKRQAQIYGCPHCYGSGGVSLERMEKLEP